MPEEFYFNTQSTPFSPSSSPETEKEPKFTPPPSDIFIRTSESDIEKLKASGGEISNEIPQPTPVKESPLSPQEEIPSSFTSSQQRETATWPPTPPQPPPPPPPPTFTTVTSQSVSEPVSELTKEEPVFKIEIPASPEFISEPVVKKPKYLLFVILGLIFVSIIIFGYFYLWPKITQKTAPVEPEQPAVVIPVIPTPPPPPPPPYPLISSPYIKELLEIKPIGTFVINEIKNRALELSEPGTFKIFMPKVRDDFLTSEEVILSLIPKLPAEIKPFLKEKYLIYAYYGEVNPSLGLIVEIRKEDIENLKSLFLNWEKKLVILRDLGNFFLVPPKKAIAKSFKAETILGAEIRYFPYPGEESALTYGFYENFLLITSSKESMNMALTRLQGATEQITH